MKISFLRHGTLEHFRQITPGKPPELGVTFFFKGAHVLIVSVADARKQLASRHACARRSRDNNSERVVCSGAQLEYSAAQLEYSGAHSWNTAALSWNTAALSLNTAALTAGIQLHSA